MKNQKWSVSDISHPLPMDRNILEFQDLKGQWHEFTLIVTVDRVVFGGVCNAGFLESGYLLRDQDQSLDQDLSELLSDLETFYDDGPAYVSRIVCNQSKYAPH